MTKVFITGANRGIGLGFVKLYLQKGCEVVACCRNPSQAKELQALQTEWPKALMLCSLDVTSADDLASLKATLANTPIDLIINNAGVFETTQVGAKSPRFGELSMPVWQNVFAINSIAPILVVQALYENLKLAQSPKIVAITSKMGSIDDNEVGSYYAYRSSKAALNMAMKSLSIDLKADGIACAVLHPGWVQTDMGGANASVTVQESVTGLAKVIDSLNMGNTGSFWGYDGGEIAW